MEFILILLTFCLGCKCSGAYELGSILLRAVTGLHSLYKSMPPPPLVDPAAHLKIGVGLEGRQDWSDAQLCAAELTYKLSSAIVADDEFSQRTCGEAGNWRHPGSPSFVPLAIGCVPEGFDRKKAKIVCRAQVATDPNGGPGEERREVFARYWAYFPDTDTDGKMAKEYFRKFEALEAFGEISEDSPLASLFKNGHGTRLISPFHPESNHFDVQFRSGRRQTVCRVILDTRPEPMTNRRSSRELPDSAPIAIERLSYSHPILFHRLMSDIFHQIPKGLPSVAPRPVESLGHIKDHLARLLEFIDLYRYLRHKTIFTVVEDEQNAVNEEGFMTQSPLIFFSERVIKCIKGVQLRLEGKQNVLHSCTDGMSVWSRDQRCPPSSLCYDSPMCSRVMACGNGLWLAVRGQHSLEATSRIVKDYTPENFIESIAGYAPASYDYDDSTRGFYEFPAKDRPIEDENIIWQKMHVSKGTAAMFVLMMYHQPSDQSGIYPKYERKEVFGRRFSSGQLDGDSLEQKIDQFDRRNVPRPMTFLSELEIKEQKTTDVKKSEKSNMNVTFYASLSDSDSESLYPKGRIPNADSDNEELVYSRPISGIPKTDNEELSYSNPLSSLSPSTAASTKAKTDDGRTYLFQYDDGNSKIYTGQSQRPASLDEDDFALIDNSPILPGSGVLLLPASAPVPNPYKQTPNSGYMAPEIQVSSSLHAAMRRESLDRK